MLAGMVFKCVISIRQHMLLRFSVIWLQVENLTSRLIRSLNWSLFKLLRSYFILFQAFLKKITPQFGPQKSNVYGVNFLQPPPQKKKRTWITMPVQPKLTKIFWTQKESKIIPYKTSEQRYQSYFDQSSIQNVWIVFLNKLNASTWSIRSNKDSIQMKL